MDRGHLMCGWGTSVESGLRRLLASVVLTAVLFGGVGCSDYSFERQADERGTLGEELFAVWRKDAVRAPRDAEARTAMLDRRRQGFIDAVDTAVPPDDTKQLDTFLRRSSFSIDHHRMQPVTKKLRLAMLEAADNEEVLEALDGRGYPDIDTYLETSPSLIAHIAEYPDLAESLRPILNALARSDGWTPDGESAPDESREFRGTQRALAAAMEALSEPGSRDTVFRAAPVVLRGALMTEQAVFEVEGARELAAVRYDSRGFPRPQRSPNGTLPFPLTDDNDDGMADIDEEGRFLLQSETANTIEPFRTADRGPVRRDDRGRAVTDTDDSVFEYLDLTRTGLFHSVGTVADWTEAGVQWQFIDGLPALLGDQQSSGRYSPEQPVVDLVHAGLSAIDIDEIGSALAGLGRFLHRERAAIAEISAALEFAADTIEQTPGTELGDDQTIDYDLIPLLRELSSDPELWADVVAALDDPIVRRADEAFATMLRYRNKDIAPAEDGPYNQCFETCRNRGDTQWADADHPHGIGTVERYQCITACSNDAIFSEQTDFDEPESRQNRSISQRLFHLLRDVSGTPYSMEITSPDVGPPVFLLDNSAEAFIDSIAQEVHLRDLVNEEFEAPLLGLDPDTIADFASTLSTLTGVELDTRPRPSQITRLFNQEDVSANILGFEVDISDPICKDGYVMANHHADILYAAEASGLVDTIQPLAKAFGKHGRNDLFAKFFVVLHDHYSNYDDLYEQKDGSPAPMKGSNFVSLEPALLQILQDDRLFRAISSTAATINGMKAVDGTPVVEHLRRVVQQASSPLEQPAYDGRTSVTMRDDRTTDSPTPLHYLIRGADELADRASNYPEAETALRDAASTIASDLFGTYTTDTGAIRLENPGHMALFGIALGDIGDAAARLDDQTRHEQFTRAWPQAVSDGLASQNFADVTALLDRLAENPEVRNAIDGLFAHALDDPEGRRITTAATYRLLVRSVRLATWQPIARHLADVIDPDRDWDLSEDHRHHARTGITSNVVELMRDILSRDVDNYSQRLLRRALNETVETRAGEQRSPVGFITNTLARYYRQQPDATSDFEAADHGNVLREIAGWLGDDDHGIERLYELIGLRAGSDITAPSPNSRQ